MDGFRQARDRNCFKKTFQLLNREEEKQGERPAGDSADYSDEGLAEQRQKDAQTRF